MNGNVNLFAVSLKTKNTRADNVLLEQIENEEFSEKYCQKQLRFLSSFYMKAVCSYVVDNEASHLDHRIMKVLWD